MDDDGTQLDRPHRTNRRLSLALAMIGLLAMAGAGLATRLDRSDSRIQVLTEPASDGGATTLAPDDTDDGPTPSIRGTTVDPAAYGAQGTARVTLACGDTAESREVTAFEADTDTPGPTALYWSEPAGRGHPLQVGDQFPAGSRLSWAIIGVQLGPWPPDTITDTCDTPVPAPTVPTRYTVPPTSVTAPVPGYDQAWTARATLACGDTAGTRRVTSFDATTNGAGTANLMEWDPASGRIRQLAVGDVFPVDHVLSWAIQGVFLGPWPVPQVTDGC